MKSKTSIDEALADLFGVKNATNNISSELEDISEWIKKVNRGLKEINNVYRKRTELTRKQIEEHILHIRNCNEVECDLCEEIQEGITEKLLERAHPVSLSDYDDEVFFLKAKNCMIFNPEREMVFIRDTENCREIILSIEDLVMALSKLGYDVSSTGVDF